MLKKIWPYLFILIIWFIFSSPFFLKGNVPYPSTYQVNFFAPWNTYQELSSPVKNNAMPDIINQIYPWKHFTIQTYSLGQIPFWNPHSFSGTLHLANYQSAIFSPFNLFFFILPFIDAWSFLVLLQPLLAAFFTFLFVRSLGRSTIGGLISSISFMFCGFITCWMGYQTLAFAVLFLPLSLFGIEKYFSTNKKRFLILLSITIPLSFFSGHFQISLYFLISIFVYVFIKFLLTKDLKNSLFCILYTLFGLLLSMPQLIPSIEVYSSSLRSGLFLKLEAIPLSYFPTFLSPDFYGNPVTRNDWFGHYAEWNAYIGVIALILAIYSILNKKNRQTLYLFIFSIIVLLLAFNTPLLSLLVALKIPVLSTSAASRIIVLFSFFFSILASFGFDNLCLDIKNGNNKKIFTLNIFISLLFISMWLIVLLKVLPFDKTIIARQNLILPTLIFIAFAFFVFLFIKFKKRKKIIILFSIALLILISFDMLRFATKWMPFDPKDLVFKETETLTKLKQLTGVDRFLGNLGGETVIYYSFSSVEGYDAVYIKRYGEFMNYLSNGKLIIPERSVVHISKRGEFTPKAINLLGIKYIVHKKADARAIWAFPFWEYEKETFTLIYEDEKYQIFENNNVFPRAFLINKYQVIKEDKEILNTMFSPNFDLRNEVIVEEDINLKKIDGNPGEVKILKYTPNKISLSVDAKTDSLLFLSDTYYPGWNVKVNGEDKKIYRTDYTFRGVVIEKGKHLVEFYYFPQSFKNSLILFVVGVIGIVLFSFPKGKFFKG